MLPTTTTSQESLIQALLIAYQITLSLSYTQSVSYEKQLNNFKSDGGEGPEVRGLFQCAVLATSIKSFGFYYDERTHRCRTLDVSTKYESQAPLGFWLDVEMEVETYNSDAICEKGLDRITWESDLECYAIRFTPLVEQIDGQNLCKKRFYGQLASFKIAKRIYDMAHCLDGYSKGNHEYWIGIKITQGLTDAYWLMDGTKVDWKISSWQWDQSHTTGDCVYVAKSGKRWVWRRSHCSVKRMFICQLVCR